MPQEARSNKQEASRKRITIVTLGEEKEETEAETRCLDAPVGIASCDGGLQNPRILIDRRGNFFFFAKICIDRCVYLQK